MNDKIEIFEIRTREELVKFDELLSVYSKHHTGGYLPYLNLLNTWDSIQEENPNYRNRLFSVFLDLKINFILMTCDYNTTGGIWNTYFSKGRFVGGSVTDDPLKFIMKMEIHRYNTAFITRYRSLWDKIMGLLVLMDQPDDYEIFFKGDSKKKEFKKIMLKSKSITSAFVDPVIQALTDFDNKFRTPEVHGSGSIRKWSFTMHSVHETPLIDFNGYWNWLLPILKSIDDSFVAPKV